MAKRARGNRSPCHGHRRYRDAEEAKRALRGIRTYSTRQKVPKRWFFCHRCKGYHLTSQDPRT